MITELRALAAGAAGTPSAVVIELNADRVAALLLPGKADVPHFAGTWILPNLHAQPGQLGVELLIAVHAEASLPAELIAILWDRLAATFGQQRDELFVVLKDLQRRFRGRLFSSHHGNFHRQSLAADRIGRYRRG